MNSNVNKKRRFYVILGTIALIIIVIGIFMLVRSKDKNTSEKKIEDMTLEEKIEIYYDFSKEDAIDLIKKIFSSDIYTYEAEVNDDNGYTVTVTNTLTKHKYIYYVDPTTKTYKIDQDSM